MVNGDRVDYLNLSKASKNSLEMIDDATPANTTALLYTDRNDNTPE